jgi:hypothetical protein
VFPETGQSTTIPMAICAGRLVQRECLAWAIDQGPQLPDIWGGASARERRELLKSGKVTGALVAKCGLNAIEGGRIERWDELQSEQRGSPFLAIPN